MLFFPIARSDFNRLAGFKPLDGQSLDFVPGLLVGPHKTF